MAGVNEAIVQKLAGHASIQTRLKHYTHILSDSLRKAQASFPYARAGLEIVSESYHPPRKTPCKRERHESYLQPMPSLIWWAQQDSNLRPTDYESAIGPKLAFPLTCGADAAYILSP